MSASFCSVEGCAKPVKARSLCGMHWQRWRKATVAPFERARPPVADPAGRFWRKVVVTPSCWLWAGSLDNGGYGRFAASHTKGVKAHRWSYEYLVGPIPDGLHLDHLCRVRRCVNPAHLEPVTCRENLLRGQTLQAANAAKTHCVRGHEFTPENTYLYVRPAGRGVTRRCRTCRARKAAA